MRLLRFSSLALLPLVAGVAAACASTVEVVDSSGGVTGTGGAGGTTTSVVTTATSSSTSVTTAVSSSSSSGTGGSDIGPPSDVYPAPYPDAPTVANLNGPTLATPKFYPVFFANDDPGIRAQLEDFASKVGATQYWKATTSEYGVGPAVSAPPIELAETSSGTIDDTAIQTWLAAKINGDDASFPADDQAVYLLHYPAGVTITLSDGMGGSQQSCQSFGGYHSNITVDAAHGSKNVAYAVMPRCDGFNGLNGLDAATGTESHEMIEAVTDPYVMVSPAYAQIDAHHLYWERLTGGGEIGDMCAQGNNAFTMFPELPYTVQRGWSNVASLGGHEPCVPALPGMGAYFNAAPVLKDNVKATIFGQAFFVKGVKIPVGMTKTIELDLFSDADTGGPWQVDVQEFSQTQHLTLSLDQTSGQNGQKLHLTITVDSAGKTKTETFFITSTLGNQQHGWLGIVGN